LKTTSYANLCKVTAEENLLTTTHVARVDTTFSPKSGVIPEGHCQPGTDPTPQTSQTEQRLAMLDHPWGSQRSYLKNRLAKTEYTNTQQDLTGVGYT
jgi:hypothetical protein